MQSCVCSRCFESCGDDGITYIGSNNDDDHLGNNALGDTYNDSDSSECEGRNVDVNMFDSNSEVEDCNTTKDNDDNILTHDHLDDFLTHTVPTEGLLDQPNEYDVNDT